MKKNGTEEFQQARARAHIEVDPIKRDLLRKKLGLDNDMGYKFGLSPILRKHIKQNPNFLKKINWKKWGISRKEAERLISLSNANINEVAKITESPDAPLYKTAIQLPSDLSVLSEDAITFMILTGNRFLVAASESNGRSVFHSDMRRLGRATMNDDVNNSHTKEIIKKFGIVVLGNWEIGDKLDIDNDMILHGRLWTKSNIISFWESDGKVTDSIQSIVYMLEKMGMSKKDISGIYLDLDSYNFASQKSYKDLKTISDVSGGFRSSDHSVSRKKELMRLLHIETDPVKRKAIRKLLGMDSETEWKYNLPPMIRRFLQSDPESIDKIDWSKWGMTKKEVEKLRNSAFGRIAEDADFIKVNGKRLGPSNADSIAFGYINGLMFYRKGGKGNHQQMYYELKVRLAPNYPKLESALKSKNIAKVNHFINQIEKILNSRGIHVVGDLTNIIEVLHDIYHNDIESVNTKSVANNLGGGDMGNLLNNAYRIRTEIFEISGRAWEGAKVASFWNRGVDAKKCLAVFEMIGPVEEFVYEFVDDVGVLYTYNEIISGGVKKGKKGDLGKSHIESNPIQRKILRKKAGIENPIDYSKHGGLAPWQRHVDEAIQEVLNNIHESNIPDIFDNKDGMGAVPWNQEVDYFGFTKVMPVKKFRQLTPDGVSGLKTRELVIKNLKSGKRKIGTPFLRVEWSEKHKVWITRDHEGRSRADAIIQLYGPDTEIPVHIFPYNMRARNITKEMEQALILPQRENVHESMIKDLVEGQQEDIAMKMLSRNGQLEEWGKYFKNITEPFSKKGPGKNHKHLPFLVNWFLTDKGSPNVIDQYYKRFMKNPKLHNIPLEKFSNFHEFEQKVDATVEMDTNVKDVDLSRVKPHYEDEHVKVYLGDSRPKCIHYGQGRKYGFCISRVDSSNLYNSYRGRGATFYFIYFKDKKWNSPSNMIVLHNYGSNLMVNKTIPNSDHRTTKEQLLKEFPVLEDVFDHLSHKPHTDDEKRSMEIAKKTKITDLKNINDKILWLEYNLNASIKDAEWEQIPEQQWEPLLKKSIELGHGTSFDILEKYKKHIPRYLVIQKQYQEEGTVRGLDDALLKATNQNRISWVKLLIKSGATNLNDALFAASRNNNFGMVKYLVEKGASNLNDALNVVSKHNNFEMVKYLVEKGATNFNDALIAALENNNFEMVKYLVEKGASNLNDALIVASRKNNFEMVKYLVEKGASNFNNALIAALSNKNSELVKYLVEKGATNFNNALNVASKHNNFEMVKYLVEKGATDRTGFALGRAAKEGNMKIVNYLVDNGATSLDAALHVGSSANNLELVKYSVEKGANNFALNRALNNVMRDHNNMEMVKYLSENGATDFDEAFLAASGRYSFDERPDWEMVRYFAEKGAHLHYTVLIKAAKEDNFEMVKYLVEKGSGGVTNALHAKKILDEEVKEYLSKKNKLNAEFTKSLESNNLEHAKHLIEKGVTIGRLNSMLGIYSSKKNWEMSKFLVENGATDLDRMLGRAAGQNNLDISKYIVDEKGEKEYLNFALEVSIKKGHFEITKYLIEKGALEYYRRNSHSNIDLPAAYALAKNGLSIGHIKIMKYLRYHAEATGQNIE